MNSFNGFNPGCIGEIKRGEQPYINSLAWFEAEGEKLDPTQAGHTRPDSIRVRPVDDYLASTYRDKVYAFSSVAAEAQEERKDTLIPEGSIFTLEEGEIAELNAACGSCDPNDNSCPALELVLNRAL